MQFLFNLKEVLFEQSSNYSLIQIKCADRTIYFSEHCNSQFGIFILWKYYVDIKGVNYNF